MKSDDFIDTLRRRIAVTAVGPSALRGQGKGVLSAAQCYLSRINLSQLPSSSQKEFLRWLDVQTAALLRQLPVSEKPWGAARKAINLFLRDLLYNRYLCQHFVMQRLEPWLEIPLDRTVATGLRREAAREQLPFWPGLKHLRPNVSKRFQDFASELAKRKCLDRVHLDVYLWLENR